jgi:hypothetical protein
MKLFTKFSLIATTFAAIGTTAALADDQQLENRLALQRSQNPQGNLATTVAVYGNQRGVGRSSATQEQPSESRFELRSNAHGQIYGAYVPAQ